MLTLAVVALSASNDGLWASWKERHGTGYESLAEESARRAAFDANVAAVAERALGWESALESPYTDLTPAKFNVRNGFLAAQRSASRPAAEHMLSGRDHPEAVDWRDHGLVTAVKNQGSCGSCWAFSAIASIEGQHAKTAGVANLTSLSEENLVDCVKGIKLPSDKTPCCNGCQGGLMDDAFAYVMRNQSGGVDTEASYPYSITRFPQCKFKATTVGATINGYANVPPGNESALLDAVATVGPVSVAVDAGIGWQLYFGGIMHPTLCSSKQGKMDHGVTVVGYGTEHNKDYWIIKNSWGAHWGEKGYLRLLRGKNACGVANAASYPKDISVVEQMSA